MWWPFKKKVEEAIEEDRPIRVIPANCKRMPGGGILCSIDIKVELPESMKKLNRSRHLGMLMQKARRIKQCPGCITWKRKGLCAICIQIDEVI